MKYRFHCFDTPSEKNILLAFKILIQHCERLLKTLGTTAPQAEANPSRPEQWPLKLRCVCVNSIFHHFIN